MADSETDSLGRVLHPQSAPERVSGVGAVRLNSFPQVHAWFSLHARKIVYQKRVRFQRIRPLPSNRASEAAIRASIQGTLIAADKVTTFTMSEFCRTFQPSQGAGSDHAWGGHHFMMGGAVLGGQLYGTFPQPALGTGDDSGNRGVWVPTMSLDQYGATLANWFGVGPGDMAAVFPNLANFGSQNVGFMGA